MSNQYVPGELMVSENPIKEIVHEYDDQEEFIENLMRHCLRLKNDIELQKKYKKNKEFLYVNRLSRRFYHYRDALNAPRITVCIIQDSKQNMYHRGISICSYLDIVNKEEGRDIAENRAIEAMKTKTSKYEINRGDTIKLTHEINQYNFYEYKSEYNVNITEFERKLFTPKSI